MKPLVMLVACLPLFLGACAATPTKTPHVLSGEARPDTVIQKGDAAAMTGDHGAAVMFYKQALSQEPSAATWYRLGLAEHHLDEPERAMWAFKKALELDPAHGASLQRVALHYTARAKVEEASSYLERLLALDADNWVAHNARGVLADLEQRFDEAADHYSVAIRLHSGSALLWNNLGYSRYLAGDFILAHRYFEYALQLDSSYGTARNNLALVLARQLKYAEALALMVSAGDEVAAYSDIGYLAFRMGHYARAEAFLTEAIRRSPTYNSQAYQNRAAVRAAIRAEAG